MYLCRFNDDRLGVVKADTVFDVTPALDVLPAHRYPLPTVDPLIANLPAVRARIAGLLDDAPRLRLSDVKLLCPVANPGKIIAAPVNYVDHLHEGLSQPDIHHGNKINEISQAGLFLKATSSLVGPSHGVFIQHPERRNDHEIELVAVIGKTGRNIPQADALSYVAGYCVGLDMTVRGPEERSMRKSIDSYSVVGPWLATADGVADPSNLTLSVTVNGEHRQRENTSNLIMGIAQLIAFASSFYTLYPGDILFTGTPAGVGPVKPGDRMTASVEGVGRMEVAVGLA
ncbi:2-hydroxyhepta-2,4-diene-1,7-dioate isomerase [Cupriavidus necator]|uniref:2-hydroxyhepta-2,4-diene-1,7-dioate isomerase n=1 Tax=Cupriavidus necator TaxID=106590 RepID=A0A1U9V134_CUPNE|nr:fumarylacetoacetate hydrolase family protein [Cupriavidus necator]AQV98191.1 2-hydroxyhepta-2,4-diene-1,7-dioate isomerase [Cupriavidus necator]